VLDHALAYLDPGSGSLLIQVIIASVLAVPYFLRTQIGRAISLVRGRGKPSESTTESQDEATRPETT
jgi:hypothetical protein